VPLFPSTSLTSPVTARPQRGRGEPPAAWQSRVVPLPAAVLPLPLHASPRVPTRDRVSMKSNLNAGALRAGGISPYQNAARVLGIVLFARSPPLPIFLCGCTDVTGASEPFGDKTACFGPRDAFFSLLYKKTALSYNSHIQKAKPAGGR